MGLTQVMKDWSLPMIFFLFTLGLVVQWPITQQFIIHRHCTVKYDDTICDEIHSHKDIQNEVQSEASQFMTYQSLFNDVPGAIMALVLGAASDKYGRKRVMMLPCFGGMGLALSLMAQTLAEGISLKYFFVGGLLWGCGGGIATFMASITNYITDTTPEEARTERLSKVLPFMGIGVIVGILLSGALSERSAYIVLFCTSVISLCIIYFFVDDVKLSTKEDQVGVVNTVKENIKKGFNTFMAWNDRSKRKQLWSIVFAGFISSACIFGEGNLIMFFTKRSPFEWTPQTFGIYSALKQIANVVGQSAGPVLFYKFAGKSTVYNDMTLLQLGHLGFTASCLSTAIAFSNTILFLGVILVAFCGPMAPAASSIISRLVPAEDKGSFTAFTGFLNTLAAPLGAFVFNNLYSWSVTFDAPSLVFYVMAIFNFIIVFMLSYVKSDTTQKVDDKKKDE